MNLPARLILGCLALVASVVSAQAQSPISAEARLKEKNITLPTEPKPAANYVNAARAGNLLFMAGNTSGGPEWTLRGKVGKDLNVVEGYEAGLIMLAKIQVRLAASIK